MIFTFFGYREARILIFRDISSDVLRNLGLIFSLSHDVGVLNFFSYDVTLYKSFKIYLVDCLYTGCGSIFWTTFKQPELRPYPVYQSNLLTK